VKVEHSVLTTINEDVMLCYVTAGPRICPFVVKESIRTKTRTNISGSKHSISVA